MNPEQIFLALLGPEGMADPYPLYRALHEHGEVIAAGQAFHFPAGTVHRLTALADTRIIEVSTPQLDDVVRLEDNYGREGTSDP